MLAMRDPEPQLYLRFLERTFLGKRFSRTPILIFQIELPRGLMRTRAVSTAECSETGWTCAVLCQAVVGICLLGSGSWECSLWVDAYPQRCQWSGEHLGSVYYLLCVLSLCCRWIAGPWVSCFTLSFMERCPSMALITKTSSGRSAVESTGSPHNPQVRV